MQFIPKYVFFEPAALSYPLGQEIKRKILAMNIPIEMTPSHNRLSHLKGLAPSNSYCEAKKTLVVGVRKTMRFASCKPSAHYQLPLNTSCPSLCEYCYLNTTLGKKPYVRIYVNVKEILDTAAEYIKQRIPEVTVFEGAATSDPIPTEYLSGVLKETIAFFGEQKYGRFRFVTKHENVDSLLDVKHNGHTRFRFSINSEKVISRFEHQTPCLEKRIEASVKALAAGYPIGFIVAPIFIFDEWQQAYEEMFLYLDKVLPQDVRANITFEFITHRFTKRAKQNILEVFSHTGLPLKEQERQFKFGQFGYGKYIYKKEDFDKLKDFMIGYVHNLFPLAKIKYFV